MIGQLCSKPAVTASPLTTAREAAHRMATKRVGALVVVDAERHPIGIVTDRDITTQVVARGEDPATVQLGSLIRRRVAVIHEEQGVLDATRALSKHGVRRLPVVNRSGAVIGIIALDDLVLLLGAELRHIASALASELGRGKI